MKKVFSICLMLAMSLGINAYAGDNKGGEPQKAKKAKTEKTAKKGKKKGEAKGEAAAKKPEMQFNEGAQTSVVRWDKMVYDFGEVAYGSDVSHVFTFKNVSAAPVAITTVGTSCGCTTPQYVREPVQPGKNGTVTAKYDSTRPGGFNKTLTVELNGETIILTIKGTVKPAESEPKAN